MFGFAASPRSLLGRRWPKDFHKIAHRQIAQATARAVQCACAVLAHVRVMGLGDACVRVSGVANGGGVDRGSARLTGAGSIDAKELPAAVRGLRPVMISNGETVVASEGVVFHAHEMCDRCSDTFAYSSSLR